MSGRRALLVLGMHRSGTSALTRVMNLCGAALPDHVLPANHANPAGYWEPAAVVAFHDRLLASAGSSWDDPSAFPPDWWTSAAMPAAADELASIVAAEFGEAPLVVVKDPRACRLLPIWQTALARLGIEPAAILVVRHPLEVAASLMDRDGMAREQALLIWLHHVLAAEADSRAWPRVVVTFDQLLDDWPAVVARIGGALGLSLPARSPGVDAEIAAFLSPSLRHARVEEAALEASDIAAWIRRVRAWHERASTGVEGDRADLDRIRADLRDAAALYEPRVRAWRDASVRQAADLQAARDEAAHARADVEAGRLARQQERDAAAARERDVIADLARLEGESAAKTDAIARLQATIDRSLDQRVRRLLGRGRR